MGAGADEKHNEARLRQLERHLIDALLIVDRDSRIRYHTASAERILGYRAVDLDGAAVGRIVHPDDVDHLAGFIEALVPAAPGAVRSTDVRLLRADDSLIHAEVFG